MNPHRLLLVATAWGPWGIAFYVIVNLIGLAIVVLLIWGVARWFNQRWRIEVVRKRKNPDRRSAKLRHYRGPGPRGSLL